MADLVQVSTTLDSPDSAAALAHVLVERRLAACVQVIGPIESTFRWADAVQTAPEWLCLIKARDADLPEIVAVITDMHPYDLPEIVAVPIVGGHAPYLAWLVSSTRR